MRSELQGYTEKTERYCMCEMSVIFFLVKSAEKSQKRNAGGNEYTKTQYTKILVSPLKGNRTPWKNG